MISHSTHVLDWLNHVTTRFFTFSLTTTLTLTTLPALSLIFNILLQTFSPYTLYPVLPLGCTETLALFLVTLYHPFPFVIFMYPLVFSSIVMLVLSSVSGLAVIVTGRLNCLPVLSLTVIVVDHTAFAVIVTIVQFKLTVVILVLFEVVVYHPFQSLIVKVAVFQF